MYFCMNSVSASALLVTPFKNTYLKKGVELYNEGVKKKVKAQSHYQDQKEVVTKLNTDSLNYNVHVFYYAWYGKPQTDGRWWHWNHKYLPTWDKKDHHKYPTGTHVPPEDIGSNFYPKLGPYSSRDPVVVAKHMEMISGAGAGVISVSWYPPGMADGNGPPTD